VTHEVKNVHLNPSQPRNNHPNRYKDDQISSAKRDLPKELRSVWGPEDGLDMRIDGEVSLGINQPELFYFYGPLVTTKHCHTSVFNLQPLRTQADTPYPIYGDSTATGAPLNVKGGCSYVGAICHDLPTTKMDSILPADAHPDGWPYG